MIVVVDYGVGNIASVLNMLKRVGAKAKASNSREDIEQADKLILPGVGAFDAGMQTLRSSGLIEVLNEQVLNKHKPVMGVCLGSQMLGNGSEEGNEPGLGWIDMDIVRFEKRDGRKVPHMGWNEVNPQLQHSILTGIDKESRFYFVHSYYMLPRHAENTLLTANYDQQFTAAVVKDNIFGFQFHPEKSHKFGMQLFKNFVELI
ncbi:imidazole glycerol phosphate synthase, glutamine amidotransferase subunit with HisF [Pseudomonas sp. JV551A1]|uniref:Imidazole glycerol phosphate synthase subunit HisH n=1 Tax=Pseudomonas inefficax TaxID=2078786 RepID=A0AAQ1P7Z9_9PSED|nr:MULTISPECIES: imidazole glycerol phosphate synthase subunit HisH [Pseudomonas]SPO53942.1 imidazole glycerol phosphate synthase, glutamine amidotransferase subunit with HisF [Pseudomonas sp. JV551A1]SPO60181.1 imidazole glycerol phosphate synthase, glutamine amidotransferase subunit with HisF [Pseudomonas inefficax]